MNDKEIKDNCRHCGKKVKRIKTVRGRYYFEPVKVYFCRECALKLRRARVIYQ